MDDVAELGEALLALMELLDQFIDDQLRRGRYLKQRPLYLRRDRNHCRVGERDQLFIVARWREQRAG